MADNGLAYGAGGASDFLQKFLADKFAQEKFAEEQRQAKAVEAAELARRNQQADQFHAGQAAQQAELVDRRDQNYQQRLEGVRTRDQNILDRKADREADLEARRLDTEARMADREDQQAFTAGEHKLTREAAAREGALTRASMESRAAATRNKPMSPETEARMIDRLSSKYLTNTKSQRAAIRNYELMGPAIDSIKQGKRHGTAEQAIVNGFNKILDPDSVVREGEYSRSAEGQPLLNRIKDFSRRLAGGGQIAPQTLIEMAELSKQYAEQAASFNAKAKQKTTALANHFEIDPGLIFMGDDDDDTPGAAPAAPGAGAGAPAIGTVRTMADGRQGRWDGKGWLPVK